MVKNEWSSGGHVRMVNNMNMIFPHTLLHYFMQLQFKFDIYDKKYLSDT
jgi:hypothetical protein